MTMTTLVSFLGKGDPRKGYRRATYRFNADVAYTETTSRTPRPSSDWL